MKTFWKVLVTFLAITGAVVVAGAFDIQFENAHYWDRHGVAFLIGIAIFPRLTLLFSSVPFGGIFWWLGWAFAPRMLVAVLATLTYWNQNPLLVIIAWLVALGGESSEKTVLIRRSNQRRQKGFDSAKWV
jgi:hypothetical protein